MKTKPNLAYAYLRLSREEAQSGESSSITNQRDLIKSYCDQNGITLLKVFSDDGWSGGNFNRPGFQEMIRCLDEGKANMVITKDLSRLGRDMREASYYAEQYFPEKGIHYLTISDNFDTERDNIMAPFQFAMNEVYLRDGSRKVKEVLKSKRERGLYCACPPYGYKKNPTNKSQLIPDEMTAPIVQRIFAQASNGDSSRKIALELTNDGVIPPLKYRVLYRDEFTEDGAAYASDSWNYTTVKRILKNPVYLGHTALGKSRKISVKSSKKVRIPRSDWAFTEDTHEPLVSQAVFNRAQENLGRGLNDFRSYEHVRKSIFSGMVVCQRCGYSLCSAGTVYKGEREKYWYLTCTHQRSDISNPCAGVRIRYSDLLELVRQDLNSLLTLSDDEIAEIVQRIIGRDFSDEKKLARKAQAEKAKARLGTIDKIISKLYLDNAEGRLSDARMSLMVDELEKESIGLNAVIEESNKADPAADAKAKYDMFFSLVKDFTAVEELDRDTLLTFIDKIEVGPKQDPNNPDIIPKRNQPFCQTVRIFYRFIGELSQNDRKLPLSGDVSVQHSAVNM